MSVPVPKDIKKTIDDAIDLALYYMVERPEETIDENNLDYDARIINHTISDLYRILDLLMITIANDKNPTGDKSKPSMYAPKGNHRYCVDKNHDEYKEDDKNYRNILRAHYTHILGIDHKKINDMIDLTMLYIPKLQNEIPLFVKSKSGKGMERCPKVLKKDAQIEAYAPAIHLYILRELRNRGIHRESLSIQCEYAKSMIVDNTHYYVLGKEFNDSTSEAYKQMHTHFGDKFDVINVPNGKVFMISRPYLENSDIVKFDTDVLSGLLKNCIEVVSAFWNGCSRVLELNYESLIDIKNSNAKALIYPKIDYQHKIYKHDIKKLIDCNELDETKMKDLYDYIKTCIKK